MWGEEQVVDVDGLRLRVVRRGSGQPLLLVNGIGASAEMWTPFTAALRDRELIAFDLPGSGASPPTRMPLRMHTLARIVTGLLDRLGQRSIDLLGYSFGGMLAQELARRAPQRIDRLVLCATTTGIDGIPPDPLRALLMLTPARYYGRRAAELIVPLIAGGRIAREPQALERHLVDRLARPPSLLGYLGQLYALTGWTSSLWLSRVHHRTLVVHGDRDPLVPVANARRIAASMPRARLCVIPGGGHLLLLDQSSAVADEIGAFLRA